MTLLKNLKQYQDMLLLLYRHGSLDLYSELKSINDLPPDIKKEGQQRGKAEDFVRDLERLGPFYIKFGQILSSMTQLLPPEYEEALQKLQDHTEPMPYEKVKQIFIEELGDTPEHTFKNFSEIPISSASLGQVHLAELKNGKKVAVKIQRADIQNEICDQLEALEKICLFLEEKTDWGKKFHMQDKFQHLKTTLFNELDYIKESDNLKILNKNLNEFENILIPLPIEGLTTSKILTMDYIEGYKILNISPLEKMDINALKLANDLFRAFLKQVLVDGFFQMDPHPGNIYMTMRNEKACLTIYDLGMIGQIPFQMQGQLLRCLFFLSEGYELDLTKMMIQMGKKLENFDEYSLRVKVSNIIGSYQGRTLARLPIGKVVLALAQDAADAGLWLPIQFSTIGKTFLSLNPVLKALDPNFNPNDALKEHSSQLLSQRLKRQLSLQTFYGAAIDGIEFFQHLPLRINEIFDYVSRGDFRIKMDLFSSESIEKNFEKIANRITTGLILAALVIGAALLMRIETPFTLFGYPGFAIIMFSLSALGALLLVFSIIWNDTGKKS